MQNYRDEIQKKLDAMKSKIKIRELIYEIEYTHVKGGGEWTKEELDHL